MDTLYSIRHNVQRYNTIITVSGATFNDTTKTITVSGTTALSGLTTDVTISSPANNQVLQYNGSKWINTKLTSGSSTLSTLTDCSISSPSNDQVLVFTTDSSLNKWTPYTLSGATFNNTTKQLLCQVQLHYLDWQQM